MSQKGQSFQIGPSQTYQSEKFSLLEKRLSIPDFQRLINPEHVQKIYDSIKSQIEAKQAPLLPGCLIICQHQDTRWLVDGQHRYAAYHKIWRDLHDDLTVTINVIQVSSDGEAKSVFEMVNKSVPIPKMPEGVSLNIPNQVTTHFSQKYPKIFSLSLDCRRPHLNRERFTEAIGKLLKSPSPGHTASEIINILEEYNRVLYRSHWQVFRDSKETQSSIEESRNKATQKGGLYFGLFKGYNWLYQLFGRDDLLHSTLSYKKQKIPQHLRAEVWSAHVGNKYHVYCPVCHNNIISPLNFHAGHLIPEVMGGQITVENLRPLCGSCNCSLGTKVLTGMKFDYTSCAL